MDENKVMNEEIVEETAPVTEEKNDDKSGLVVLGLAIVGGITIGRFAFNKGKEALRKLKQKDGHHSGRFPWKETEIVDESEEEEPEE